LKRITFLLLVSTLTGCAGLFLPPAPEQEATNRLLKGIHELRQKDSSTTLESLIQSHPDSSEARAAKDLLRLRAECTEAKKADAGSELEKLRQENSRLQDDLEQLRQLLIQSEKSAS